MDIENLSKTELILTALFISFVTALITGIVVIFLSEDAPEDVIRVTDRVVSEEATTSAETTADADTSTTSNGDQGSAEDDSTKQRDSILAAAVKAVARVTSEDTSPQAGVLVDRSGQDAVITSTVDFSTNPQALFEDGVVADLELPEETDTTFSLLAVQEASGALEPLAVSSETPEVGNSAFVVPLSQQPEIVRVEITDTAEGVINTSAGMLPPVSMLLDNSGALVGIYDSTAQHFRSAAQISR